MSVLDDLIADDAADLTPYDDASEADLIAHFLGFVVRGTYASQGEFILALSIPADLDVTQLMKTRGEMVYLQVRKC